MRRLRNAFANNISTGIKLSKAQISKTIQSSGSFGSWLANLAKKALTNVAISFTKENLPGLVTNLASNEINKFEIKVSGKGAVRAGKRFILFFSNEVLNDIIKIIKSLVGLNALIDRINWTVKLDIKRQ